MSSVARKPETQSSHDKWVDAIARDRFGFPNSDYPTWTTHTNPGSTKNARVLLASGAEVYPDVVVIDAAKPNTDNVPVMAEVETADSVIAEEVEQWKEYGSDRESSFYLYVPKGSGQKAKQLAEGIRITGIREYSNENGKNTYVELK